MNKVGAVITAAALLALGAVAVGVLALAGDDAASPQSRPEPPVFATAAQAVTQLTPTPTPPHAPADTPAPAPSVPALPDRANCDEIRGTPYRSQAEREFFLANCLEPTAVPAAAGQPSVVADTSPRCTTSVDVSTTRSDQTYDVSGLTLGEIADSLDANAPLIDGAPAYGLTEYSYGLDGSFCRGAGTCTLGEISIDAGVTVTLPNLTTISQVSGEIAAVWTQYAGQVSLHEERHVRILEQGLEEIRRQLLLIPPQPDCDRLDREIDKVWALGSSQIDQRQRAFHVADAQGAGGLVVQ